MTFRFAASLVAVSVALATPALAIMEVPLGPRTPAFANAGAGLGWEPLQLPAQVRSDAFAPVSAPANWAFSSGETTRIGGVMFNVTSGPSWMLDHAGFAPLTAGHQPLSLGRMGDFGWTTRTTAGVMASDRLMFYTSVGHTTFSRPGSLAPLPPGLALIEPPTQRMDMRAGFRMELMPGLTFGAEASFAPATR